MAQTLTVVAWNVARGRPSAWQALDQLGPDVALLTEAVVPDGRSGVWQPTTRGLDGKHRPWAAAVVTDHPHIEPDRAAPVWRIPYPMPVTCSRPGAWAVAVVDLPGLGAVTAISLYGLMDEFSDASMHRSLTDVQPLVDDRELGAKILLGGDFNTGTQWPPREAHWNRRDAGVLERLAAWGLVDLVDAHRPPGPLDGCRCADGPECRHVRTRRDPRWPDVPYQTDYLWATPTLAELTLSCEVLADDTHFGVSDHPPIVAELQA